ncbi:chemosensory protein 1 [Nomia melanderi]|uniref:chemosensory protein 1 n=1 Tax=Nomia melanderi TaxID=2448451 RepID=UPI00130473A0|nr:ejaculatory bulb-specific protein 3-like [Nomia melanderi]
MNSKSLMLFVSVLSVILAVTYADEDEDTETYTSKYDDINVDEILTNSKLRKQYENCYLDKGPCVTPDAVYFKDKFVDIFTTNCKKCTAKQVQFYDKIVSWYAENDQDTWNTIVEKTLEDARKLGKAQ